MPGEIKRVLDRIVEERSQGDDTVRFLTRAKLAMKGFHPDKYTDVSDDDAAVLIQVKELARELGISID